jgi:tetratricopeptide (TPR) repeat protein
MNVSHTEVNQLPSPGEAKESGPTSVDGVTYKAELLDRLSEMAVVTPVSRALQPAEATSGTEAVAFGANGFQEREAPKEPAGDKTKPADVPISPTTMPGNTIEPPRFAKNTETITAPKAPEDIKQAITITEMRSGPDKLSRHLSDSALKQEGPIEDLEGMPPPQRFAMEATADLFADRDATLVKDGERSESDDLRVVFMGSGGEDAGAFLDCLREKHEDVYARTTVEVSNPHQSRLDVAKQSPQLADHNKGKSQEGDDATEHVTFAQRDIHDPRFEDDERPPDLIVAATALSLLPAHVVALDSRKYEQGRVAEGQLAQPIPREVQWAGHIAGPRPLVKINETGAVETTPVRSFGLANYLDIEASPADRDRYRHQLVGRYTEGNGSDATIAGITDRKVPILGADIAPERGLQFAGWQHNETKYFLDTFQHGNGTELTPSELYNFTPGVNSFVQNALAHPDRRTGLMVMVWDWMRRTPSAHVPLSGTDGLQLAHTFGMVSANMLEGWSITEQARRMDARVKTTNGPEGGWGAMLIDTDDLGRALVAESDFTKALVASKKAIDRQRLFRQNASDCLTNAMATYKPGAERDAYVQEQLEVLYAGIFDADEGYTSAAVSHDRTMLVEVAGWCNDCRQYDAGLLFAQRALDIASNISIEGYRQKATAQTGLGNTTAAIQTLRDACEVSTEHAQVWGDLRELYRAEGQWGLFVDATINYINCARNLDSGALTALLLEMCQAQEEYSHAVADSTETAAVMPSELHIQGQGITVLGEEYGPLQFTHENRAGIQVTVSEQERLRTYRMYETALTAAQKLRDNRGMAAWEGEERTLTDWIKLLHEGRERTRPSEPATFAPDFDLAHSAVIRPLSQLPFIKDARLVSHEIREQTSNPGTVGKHLQFIMGKVLGTEAKATPATSQNRAAPNPEQSADDYMNKIFARFGMSSNMNPVVILALAETRWDTPTSSITDRVNLAETLIGRHLGSNETETVPALQDLFVSGGPFKDLLKHLAILEEQRNGDPQ